MSARELLPHGLASFRHAPYTWRMNVVAKQNMKAFLKGFASAFDFSGRHLVDLQSVPGGFERDGMMLRGDWIRVGGDIRKAMDMVAHEQRQKHRSSISV